MQIKWKNQCWFRKQPDTQEITSHLPKQHWLDSIYIWVMKNIMILYSLHYIYVGTLWHVKRCTLISYVKPLGSINDLSVRTDWSSMERHYLQLTGANNICICNQTKPSLVQIMADRRRTIIWINGIILIIQWNYSLNSCIFIHENVFKHV